MKTLRTHLAEYLEMRRGHGFKTKRHEWLLSSFLTFLEVKQQRVISSDLALDWAKNPAEAHPGSPWTWSRRQSPPSTDRQS